MAEYHLQFFLAGESTSKNREAIESVQKALDLAVKNNYVLEIIDVLTHPEKAAEAEVLVTPTLLATNSNKKSRIVGDMTDAEKVKISLELIIRHVK